MHFNMNVSLRGGAARKGLRRLGGFATTLLAQEDDKQKIKPRFFSLSPPSHGNSCGIGQSLGDGAGVDEGYPGNSVQRISAKRERLFFRLFLCFATRRTRGLAGRDSICQVIFSRLAVLPQSFRVQNKKPRDIGTIQGLVWLACLLGLAFFYVRSVQCES